VREKICDDFVVFQELGQRSVHLVRLGGIHVQANGTVRKLFAPEWNDKFENLFKRLSCHDTAFVGKHADVALCEVV
jgi:hypothetical protein